MIRLFDQISIENKEFIDSETLIDLFRLQKQLVIKEHIFFTIDECYNIWQNYSNDVSASWLSFPEKDEDILNEIRTSDFFTSFEEYAKC